MAFWPPLWLSLPPSALAFGTVTTSRPSLPRLTVIPCLLSLLRSSFASTGSGVPLGWYSPTSNSSDSIFRSASPGLIVFPVTNVKRCLPSGRTGSLPPLPPRTAFSSVPSGSGISAVQSPVLESAFSTIAQTVASLPPCGTLRRLYFPSSILTAIFEAPWPSCGWHHPLPLTFTVPPRCTLAFSTLTVGSPTDVHLVGSRTVNCSEVIDRLTSFVSDCPESRETVKY